MCTDRRVALRVIVASLLFLFAISFCAHERRPVEGKWVVEGARGLQLPSSPLTYHVLAGDKVTLRFRVEESDLDLYYRSFTKLDMPAALMASSHEGMSAQDVQSFVAGPEIPGAYDVSLRMESPEMGFTLEYSIRIEVHSDIASIEKALAPIPCPGPVRVDPSGVDANSENSAARKELAPENYAHIHGLAPSYSNGSRRYMLRGLKLELRDWPDLDLIATVHTADPIGEGRCESEFNDYIDTFDNSYHHVTNSGSYDFGNIYVGAGKDLVIREVFQFYAGATGSGANGAHRCTTEEYGYSYNDQIYLDWLIGHIPSGYENPIWLQGSMLELSASNGMLGDEAQHVQLDAARMYHYFAECAGFSSGSVTRFIIDLTDTDAPYHQTGDIYLNGWDNSYLWSTGTDTIRHEYSHAMMYRMRGDNMPDRDGGTNHGNCDNPNSVDALIEGFAIAIPTLVNRDGNYQITSGNSANMDSCSWYCSSVPNDRDEWAVGRAIWKSWTLAGATDVVFGNLVGSMANRDPNDVQSCFNGWVLDCSFDRQLWDGFWCSQINYDTTMPSLPVPIYCNTDQLNWTSDPLWYWDEPSDDLSGIGGYSVLVVAGIDPVLPDTTRDIDDVLSYSTTSLPPDGNITFNIRPQDRAGNWNNGSISSTVGLDRVLPGLATNLLEIAPPELSVWSNWPHIAPMWTPATDDRSGLDGYSWAIVNSTTQLPDFFKDIEEDATIVNTTLPSSTDPQYFALRSKDNAGNWSATAAYLGPYHIDAVAPGAAVDFHSTSHTAGVWSNDTTVDFAWVQAPDAHSGIQGYSICSDTLACTPAEAMTIGDVTSTTVTLAHSDVGYFTSLRALDNAGNWGDSWPTIGPINIDTVLPTTPGNLSGNFPLGIGECVTGDIEFSASWSASYDGNSGIAAYAYSISLGDWQRPPEADHLPAGATNVSLAAFNSSQPQFFNIMARDAAGNWSDFIAYGPFFHDRSPLPVGNLILALPEEPAGSLQIDWNGTGESGYFVEWVTAFDSSTPDDWSDNENYGGADVAVQAYTHNSPPSAQCVFYRVRGKNGCGALGD